MLVAFFGTRDTQRSREFLEDWIEYQEKQQTMTFTERETSQHYAVTDDYVLFTTDPDLLEETIDRIEDGDSTGSLEESGRFQEARDAPHPAPGSRCSTWTRNPSGGIYGVSPAGDYLLS